MEVLLYNGTRVKITKVTREVLETPETTYNFEVEDYHTYYVSDSGVLVHNTCVGDILDDVSNAADNAAPRLSWGTERRRYWKSQGGLYKENITGDLSSSGAYRITENNINRMLSGKAPIGVDGYSVHLHHVVGKSTNFYNYVEITRTAHYANFKALHPWLF